MMNGTVIGSATPIVSDIPTGETNSTMTKDIGAFTTFMQALTANFGRNGTAAGLMVSAGASPTARRTSLKLHMIDGIVNASSISGALSELGVPHGHPCPDGRGQLPADQHPERPQPLHRPLPRGRLRHHGRPLPSDVHPLGRRGGSDGPGAHRLRLLRRPSLGGPVDVHRRRLHIPRGQDPPRRERDRRSRNLHHRRPSRLPEHGDPGAARLGHLCPRRASSAPDPVTYGILAALGVAVVVGSVYLYRLRRDLDRRKRGSSR